MFVIIVLLGIAGFSLSGQTADDSLSMSDHILVKLNLVTLDEVEAYTVHYRIYSNTLREVFHFIMYGVASFCIFGYIYLRIGKLRYTWILTLVICIAYAFFDEFHQELVDGRGYELFDLYMDSFGVVFGSFVCGFGIWIGRR